MDRTRSLTRNQATGAPFQSGKNRIQTTRQSSQSLILLECTMNRIARLFGMKSKARPSPVLLLCTTISTPLKTKTFYAQSPYGNLDPTEHQIRLLKPLPSGNDGIPSFTLFDNCPLDSVRSCYTALSYCAGGPDQTEAINVNGAKFNAFANLSYA
jgi:hypothetical protein